MTPDTLEAQRSADVTPLADISGSFFRRQMLRHLAQITVGRLTLIEGDERVVLGSADADTALCATLHIHSADAWRLMALGGSVAVAEAYMDGLWDSDDLVAMVRIFVRNREVLDGMEGGFARFTTAALRLWHGMRRNTKRGSRRNIAAHYDLGNEFFALFLDPSLMYSSAIYVDASDTLEAAQQRRLDRICQKLDLQPGERVVEIGTGWGGFAIHAARHYGVHVTTTTISQRQYDLACERVAAAGLQDRITLLLQDYRDLSGRYDKLVSIEMIEAIGHQYLDTYFRKVDDLLLDHGAALIQAITIEDHRYERALKDIDFIKRYIFPGSFIPSVGAMTGAIARASRLRLTHLEDIGPSYACTLRAWHERLLRALPQVRQQGYSEAFIRMWRWYLAYCEGGFLERSIGDVHLLLSKPGNRRPQYLPDLKATL
jgi:cyclopropane-fatty-acyl-phospholipid synthase